MQISNLYKIAKTKDVFQLYQHHSKMLIKIGAKVEISNKGLEIRNIFVQN